MRDSRSIHREFRRPGRIYRSRDKGWIFGVCAGLAEHFDMPIWAVRVLFILIGVSIGAFWFPIAYIITGMLMPKAPPRRFRTFEQEQFWQTYEGSRGEALRKVADGFGRLDQRVQHLESLVTSRDFDYDEKYQKFRNP